MRARICCAVLAVIGALSSFAQSPALPPAVRLTNPPTIDGRLNPGEWDETPAVDQFWYIQEGKPAPHRTTVRMGYDDDALYFAFDCEDPLPAEIRGEGRTRNLVLSSDDVVAVGIDPSGRNLMPYWFYLNAGGTQKFDAPAETDPNIQWQGDWQGAAARTEKGWSAEFRIPASVIRPPRNQRTFGLMFVRVLPRFQQFYTFPPMPSPALDETLTLPWTGLSMPALRYAPILKPYLKFDTEKAGGSRNAGLDARLIDPSGLTALLTINPDFADIARDVAGIDFTYTERYLSETRSFFLEGAGYLPREEIFYTPRVTGVTAGAKAFGRAGALQYGALSATDGDERSSAARLNYQLRPRTFAYVDAVEHKGLDARGSIAGFGFDNTELLPDGLWGLSGFYYQQDGRARNRAFAGAEVYRSASARRPNWRLGYLDIGPNFTPPIGFLPEVGYRSVYGSVGTRDNFESGPLYNWTADLSYHDRKLYGGGTLDEEWIGSAAVTLRNETLLQYAYTWLRRPPNVDRLHSLVLGWHVYQPRRSGQVFVDFGRLNGGDSVYYGVVQNLQLARSVRVGLSYSHIDLRYPEELGFEDYIATQVIATLSWDLTPESGISGRFVGTGRQLRTLDETNNFFLSYWRRVRRGADLFVIWGLPNADRFRSQRVAVKLVMPFSAD